ncbi:hypothetical protein ACWEF9_17985 [Streptomyces sp. NPDC004980]
MPAASSGISESTVCQHDRRLPRVLTFHHRVADARAFAVLPNARRRKERLPADRVRALDASNMHW